MTTVVQTGVHTEASSRQHPLQMFFAPEAVAVIGATEEAGSVGRAVMANLIHYPFGGTIFPISSEAVGILGVKAYRSLQAVPLAVDLALIAAPAARVPDIIGDCVQAGVQAAIILSPGFRESGPEGADLERRVQEQLRQSPMRVLGPGSLGIACPFTGLNATIAPAMVRPGTLGILTQSGALLTPLLSNDVAGRVGCSAFISVGNMLDVDWAEWLDYLAEDPRTESIGIYLETLRDAPAFFKAIRRLAPHKPVIVVKGGKREMPGQRDEVLDEAFRCHGALQVHTIDELFRMADMLTTQPRVHGRHLTILSNTGGAALLATEALLADGSELTALAPETTTALEELLPTRWSHRNPVDVGEDIGPARFGQAAEQTLRDPKSDALLVILKPQGSLHPTQVAEELAAVAQTTSKPILASWMWGAANPASLAILRDAGISTFTNPEAAVQAFGYLWRHAENLRGLSEAAQTTGGGHTPNRQEADNLLRAAQMAGQTQLGEMECQHLFQAYGLPILPMRLATTESEAVEFANLLGYPVILKLHTEMRLKRGESLGLQLPANDSTSVRRVFRTLRLLVHDAGFRHFHGVRLQRLLADSCCEFMLVGQTDAQFGPMVQFSLGGALPSPRERLTMLAPLTPTRLRLLIEQSPPFAALHKNCPHLDWAVLEDFLIRFSRLIAEQPAIKEIAITPLQATSLGLQLVETQTLLNQLDQMEPREGETMH